MPFLLPWLALSVLVWSAIESLLPPPPPNDPPVKRDPELFDPRENLREVVSNLRRPSDPETLAAAEGAIKRTKLRLVKEFTIP